MNKVLRPLEQRVMFVDAAKDSKGDRPENAHRDHTKHQRIKRSISIRNFENTQFRKRNRNSHIENGAKRAVDQNPAGSPKATEPETKHA